MGQFGSLTPLRAGLWGTHVYAGIFWHILAGPGLNSLSVPQETPCRPWQLNVSRKVGQAPGKVRFGISLPLRIVGKLNDTCMESSG